ncbi:hypothetical protein LINGRAHAP2_LOCUS7015 [Linum grandiflorum]
MRQQAETKGVEFDILKEFNALKRAHSLRIESKTILFFLRKNHFIDSSP